MGSEITHLVYRSVMRTQERKDKYNLNEEEELTHFGQSLAEMEKMTDVIDSGSDTEENGLLSAELTASHFGGGGGGGLLRKKNTGDEDEEHKPKSRQELIEELILKSKQEKRERQIQKEEAHVLTEKLDQEWRSIQNLLSRKTTKPEQKDLPEKTKIHSLCQMFPDAACKVMQTLLSDSAHSMEETLEVRGRAAMPDLDMDGKWNLKDEEEEEESEKKAEDDEAEDEEAQDDDVESEDEEDDDAEDGHSDLQSDEGSEDDEDDEDQACDEEELSVKVTPAVNEEKMTTEAIAELPYTFTAPDTYTDLKNLLQGHSCDEQRLIVDRTVKCTHPSLCAGNKAKLQKVFGFLLEYVGELATQNPPQLKTINALIPQIHSLCQMFPDAACKVMQTLLSDSAHSMEETLEVRGRAAMPDLDMLVYLKITALLFPTSDFRHPVSTPAFLYISQTLTKCSVVSLEDVCRGLVLCCLAVEFVSLSQRFFPEMLNFLLGLLHLAVPEKTNTGYVLVSPFRQQGRNCDLLVVKDSSASLSWSRKPVSLCTAHRNTLDTPLERDHYRLSIIDACLDLVKRCTTLYTDLTSYSLIFQPIRTLLLEHLPAKSYPAEIQDVQKEIVEAISANPSQHAPLVFKKKKPIPLKLFTPKIVQILDYGKKRGDTKEEKERERLKHKYKREFKGALREIRKDSRFLAHEKLSDIISRDTERKRKVKELYGSLSTQEGEWKALKRKKGK
ncbi:nucleolar protein 14 [Triplophysa rosa]|uniref:nucleolar protein 14 n=1 Tax=Triplophysa rosa TaxID=992332 RepID=UPI002546261C|nr:nucleolar protein 14 [Triplophysa rosa]